MPRYVWYALFVLVGLFAALVLSGVAYEYLWVGSADLTIEFIVTDAATGLPIEHATVAIVKRPESPTNRGEFELRTNPQRTVRHLERDCTTAGRGGFFGLADTWSVDVPDWEVRVSARGYEASEAIYLYEYAAQARETGPGSAELVVRVELTSASGAPR